ncbi:hypothetical protein RRG08_050518 [Elysia crispata]|uniref:Uncharacterized protein n=1 Tax=Elysia crispata TaxID=231223 RepID=A0AAE0XT58_9GAST|nr:hypothetical protein RRG08_050518 [Elysia crispata]
MKRDEASSSRRIDWNETRSSALNRSAPAPRGRREASTRTQPPAPSSHRFGQSTSLAGSPPSDRSCEGQTLHRGN